jgi:ankyrin repeat protein
VVKTLLTTGQVDPDARGRGGQTPLSKAAADGHEAVIKTLLAMGQVDPDARDVWEQTPLSKAAAVFKLVLILSFSS